MRPLLVCVLKPVYIAELTSNLDRAAMVACSKPTLYVSSIANRNYEVNSR